MKKRQNIHGRLFTGRSLQAVHFCYGLLAFYVVIIAFFIATSLVAMTKLIVTLGFILDAIHCKYCEKGLNTQTK